MNLLKQMEKDTAVQVPPEMPYRMDVGMIFNFGSKWYKVTRKIPGGFVIKGTKNPKTKERKDD